MSFEILGIGVASPTHSCEQGDAALVAESFFHDPSARPQLLKGLYRRSGVRKRHSVLLESSRPGRSPDQSFYPPATSLEDKGPTTADRMQVYEKAARPLAHAAATAALEDAHIKPEEVTHLVTVSCSGFSAPGFDIGMIRDLGLSPHVARTHVGFMGCHGAMNGLRVAKAFAEADEKACALVCAVELCTLHYQYGWDTEPMVANSLFADGAAAAVGRAASHRSDAPWSLTASGTVVLKDSEQWMGWLIGDHGFKMNLSPRIPDLIEEHLRPWLAGWLAEHQLSIDKIGSWAVHPGGPRILTAVAKGAGFDPLLLAPSQEVLAQFGNMSSPTILFILQRLRQVDAPRPCVLLGFGPGLTIEMALIQ